MILLNSKTILQEKKNWVLTIGTHVLYLDIISYCLWFNSHRILNNLHIKNKSSVKTFLENKKNIIKLIVLSSYS